MTEDLAPEDALAALASSVDGVAAMHGGEFGEVATHLPGRKVVGVRITDDGCDIHIAAAYPSDVRAVARAVRLAIEPHVDVPVSVTVEDVIVQEAVIEGAST